MTTKGEAAAAERKVMDRYEARLARAYMATDWGEWDAKVFADTGLRILRASAAAVIPGDQRRKHLLPALGKMVTAACRVIRAGGGK